MKFKIVVSVSLLFLFYTLHAQSIPDSLQSGVLVQSFTVKDKNVKSVRQVKPDSLYFYKVTDQAGLAVWKRNTYFIPKGKVTYTILSGYIKIDETKSYAFRLQSIEGSILYIDNHEIIDNDGVHEFKAKDGEVYLTEGFHSFKIISMQGLVNRGENEVSLAWFLDVERGFDWVPASQFYHSKKKGENIDKLIPDTDYETDKIISENDKSHPSYDLTSLEYKDFNPKVGGLDFLSNGKLVVCTWDSIGQVFLIDNATSTQPGAIKVKRIAMGLLEPLGLKVVDDKIYVLQKHELTQLIDLDGDDIIDEYKSVCGSWGALGNFHEFAFGLIYKEGFFYATLATAINPGGKSPLNQSKDRGKAVKIGMDGSFEILASGFRTPNGIGFGVDGEIFITDNQGDWLPACKMVHLQKGAFYGSYAVDINSMGKFNEMPPVVWFPQGEIGNSTSQPALINDGPYKGQMIVGDVTHGGIKRIFVEKVRGEYQGVAFEFSQGLAAGVNRLVWGPDGALYIGEVGNGGNWGQLGKKLYGLQRIKYNGKSTFEMLAIRVRQNGLAIEFTEPLDEKTGNAIEDYHVEHWKYVPTINYGGPKLDLGELSIASVNISEDRKNVFLEINDLKEGRVIGLGLAENFKSKSGQNIWTKEAWYNLNQFSKEKGIVTEANKARQAKNIGKNVVNPKTTALKTVADPYAKIDKTEEDKIIALGPSLIAKSHCNSCHAMDQKIVGPSFKMVSERYSADPETLKKLTEKVYNGGGGVWGDYVMGAQSHLKKEDITKMVRYILSLKK